MSESPDLTAKEKFHVSLYKDPTGLFRGALLRKLKYAIPSVGLMVTWYVTREPVYAIVGYGILLWEAVRGIVLARQGIQTMNRVVTHFEAKSPK